MPKVKKDYIQNKREVLLDAAQRVCNRKCIYDVTMRDIIIESGVSQGGIYCYFKNIDEVFVALINRFTEHSSLALAVNEVLLTPKSISLVIHDLCRLLTDYMIEIVDHYGKYIYELNFLYLQYPDRFEQIKHLLNEQANISDFKSNLLLYLKQQVDSGFIHPLMPLEFLFMYWNATYEGTIQTLNLVENKNRNETIKTIEMMMTLMEETMKHQLKIREEI